MTLQEIIDAIDQLTIREIEQIKAHIWDRERTPVSDVDESNDLERMSGLFHAEVTDLSTNARDYLRDIFQQKHDRSN